MSDSGKNRSAYNTDHDPYFPARCESGTTKLYFSHTTMEDWPEYCCAILENSGGRLLLEARPDSARFAAGKLTCFGGRREAGESPEECLYRELREELNWEPARIEKQVELWIAGAPKAWFFHAIPDATFDLSRISAGHRGVFVSKAELPQLPVSPWHAAVLAAWLAGEGRVECHA